MKRKILLLVSICLTACSSVNKEEKSFSLQETLKEKEEISNALLQNRGVLSLEDALSLAKKRNLSLQQKELEKEIAKLDKRIAFGNFLPHISSFYSRNFWEEPLTARVDVPSSLGNSLSAILPPPLSPLVSMIPKQLEGRLVDKTYDIYGMQANFPIFAPATWFLYSARKKGEDISKLSYDLSEKMLTMKVIQDYYWILSLEAEKQQLKVSYDAARQLEKNMKIALQTESILEWQYQKAETFLKQKEFSLRQNERDLRFAKMTLLKTLDLFPFTNFEVKAPELEERKQESLEDAVYDAVIKSDALALRRKSIEIQKEKIKISLTKFLPIIGLQGFYGGQGLSFLQPTNVLFGAIMASLSLFNGFEDVNAYRKEVLQKKSLLLKEQDEILQVMLETANTYFKLQNSLEEKEIANLNYQAETGKLHQKKIEKQVGMIDDLTYLDALQEYEKAISLNLKANYQEHVYQEALDMLTKKGRFQEKEKKKEGGVDE